jgi:hypothetical protein
MTPSAKIAKLRPTKEVPMTRARLVLLLALLGLTLGFGFAFTERTAEACPICPIPYHCEAWVGCVCDCPDFWTGECPAFCS